MDFEKTVAYRYLKASSLNRQKFEESRLSLPSHSTENHPQEKISLLAGEEPYSPSFFSVIKQRRSKREYSCYPVTLKEISLLCFATQGITARLQHYAKRTSPSAGALYPVETYIVIQYSRDIPRGVYHLDVENFSLGLLKSGDFRKTVRQMTLDQEFLEKASAVFVWSSRHKRTAIKYGERALRYIFMDAAHICQNLLLAAEALQLKACPVGAFFDEEWNTFLGLNMAEESVIYMASVGK